MSHREQNEQYSAEVADLEVTPEESADVKGGAGSGGGAGKVQMQDFHFTKNVSKPSPS
jgi:type VI protein secretion system component Hcp